MAGVNLPQQKQDPIKGIIPIAARVVGTIYGGPAGGMAAGAVADASMSGGSKVAGPVQQQQTANPMQRRLQQEDPAAELAKAQAALQQLPPEEQAKYGPTLEEARKRAAHGGY